MSTITYPTGQRELRSGYKLNFFKRVTYKYTIKLPLKYDWSSILDAGNSKFCLYQAKFFSNH